MRWIVGNSYSVQCTFTVNSWDQSAQNVQFTITQIDVKETYSQASGSKTGLSDIITSSSGAITETIMVSFNSVDSQAANKLILGIWVHYGDNVINGTYNILAGSLTFTSSFRSSSGSTSSSNSNTTQIRIAAVFLILVPLRSL